MRIATAGSCFAQHVGRSLRPVGFNVCDMEPPPRYASAETASRFGYGLYSARYGNIYTAQQLIQLLDEAEGRVEPALGVWEGKAGRFVDAQRPGVEPEGLDSPETVVAHRALHLAAVRRLIANIDLLVFTFGLTEAWIHTASRTVYPTAPGTIAGRFDPDVFSFCNYGFMAILRSFIQVRAALKAHNPRIKFLVTVSPVPLTATASGQHVELATVYSKSVLRAVCGELVARFPDVDYFPSYEIITSTNNRGVYFEANKRNVSARGVATAMSTFMTAHGHAPAAASSDSEVKGGIKPGLRPEAAEPDAEPDTVVCEEALLEAFRK